MTLQAATPLTPRVSMAASASASVNWSSERTLSDLLLDSSRASRVQAKVRLVRTCVCGLCQIRSGVASFGF